MPEAEPAASGRRYGFLGRQRENADLVDVQLELLALSEEVVEFVASEVHRTSADHSTSSGAVGDRRVAVYQLAVLGVRSAAALNVLLKLGYEPEAMGLRRRIAECLTTAKTVSEDTSGQLAARWLEGRSASARKSAGKAGRRGEFDNLSRGAHADPVGLIYLYNPPFYIPCPPEQRALRLDPFRLADLADGMLYDTAYDLLGLAVLAAVTRGEGLEIPGQINDDMQHGLAVRERQEQRRVSVPAATADP